MAFRNIDTGIHNLQHKQIFKQVLPNFPNGASCPFGRERDTSCFLAGDERVNQQPVIAAIHMIFSRFHNLVAGELSAGNPRMSDEMVFQEARKVVIAAYQIIVYQEFLPGLLGPSVLDSELYRDAGLQLNDFEHFDHYEPETDPHVLNEFVAAGFRLHTLVSDIIPRLKSVIGLAEATALSSQYNNHSLLYEDGSADVIINGLLEEPALAFDPQISVELQGRLFRGQELPVGLDLLAISVQRGRDHGLGTYNDVREACGYGRARTFEGLGDFIPEKNIFLLRSLYRSVEDIVSGSLSRHGSELKILTLITCSQDLIVGGLLEDTVREDASVGSTFACLIATEFRTKRFSDRFWHERSHQFSQSQLNYLRRIKMSQIVCLTTGIRHVAAQSFLVVSDNNPLVPCSSAKEFNLEEFFTIPGL
ncbi:hypothetical protein RvY_09677-2 [Ramazzottius varieornatus]|uniref:Peroxidase n=1 Tax=Ramazzottius varieornatus TaxID=947166 RepID=A0A1D1VFK4_RAMVA|nr:hypothetical protein RvY_09677-2 [Ramazzottius varieornatus]